MEVVEINIYLLTVVDIVANSIVTSLVFQSKRGESLEVEFSGNKYEIHVSVQKES